MKRPRVSVAFPLYRSKRFVDCIARNIADIDDPDAEIIVSDRHQFDDTLAVLRSRFADDRRIRWVAENDRLSWVEHYDWLLENASADLFAWIPHDDAHSPGYVATLAAALEADAGAIVAHGRVEHIGSSGDKIEHLSRTELPLAPGEAWSPRAALRQLTLKTEYCPAFHGVFRRDKLLAAKLSLRQSYRGFWADAYWVFAVELLGYPCFVPSAVCIKRIHRDSASFGWGDVRLRDALSGYRVLMGYVWDFAPSATSAAQALSVLSFWTAARALATLPPSLRRPFAGRGFTNSLLRKVLAPGE